jgi:hypothetical protein
MMTGEQKPAGEPGHGTPTPPEAHIDHNHQATRGWWDCTLRVTLVLWVVRIPVVTTAFGLVLLGMTPQAQDLFLEFADAPLGETLPRMLWFVVVLTVVWAMPTHYAARLLLESDPRFKESLRQEGEAKQAPCLRHSAKWVPRVLGFLAFVAVEYAIFRSHRNIPTLDQGEVTKGAETALVTVASLVAAGAVGYWVWVIKRPRQADLPSWLKWLNDRLGYFWQAFAPGRVRGETDEESRDIGRLLLAGLFLVFVGIFYFGEDETGAIFPRAMAVPFILGGWLPLLTYLSAVGRQVRAPVISALFLLIAVLAVVLGDNHSVRRVAAQKIAPLPLEQAVDLWMTENKCNPKTNKGASVAACPRPIIIAAQGGASRAGFFMATIIGYFLQPWDAVRYGLRVEDVRNRLFAISSVSGGSTGAVMVTAALDAAPSDAEKPPCIHRRVDQWWGREINFWRDCFEALTSGDFLTADFFGFAFNDMVPFGFPRDRAAVLEDSWSNRFRQVVGAVKTGTDVPSCPDLNCPFLSLRPRLGHWIPLLVLNGTSEATGGRIVTTALANTYQLTKGNGSQETKANGTPETKAGACPTEYKAVACPLFVDAVRFHELWDQKVKPNPWWGWIGFLERYRLRDAKGQDIRLSTAAHNSARFPLISAPGSIRNGDQRIVDRIVDGGYFENYGALGAKELALAVHAIEPQLRPLVIVISNDPTDLLSPSDDALPNLPGISRPTADTGEFVTEVTAPLITFANARTAHGILGVDELRAALHAAIPECERLLIKIRVSPDHHKPLSMSWWESPLIQRRLHRQTEGASIPISKTGAEDNGNGPHLDAIWQEMERSTCKANG